SSSDPKEFVKDVGKQALDPKNWAYGYGQAGAIALPFVLMGIMTDGAGESAVVQEEIQNFSLKIPNAPAAPETPGIDLEARATEIHNTLPAKTQDFNTTAVGAATTSDGRSVTLVASNEKNLRPVQMQALKPGEIAVSGSGHAEATIVNHAQANGMTLTAVA